jgi:hypothetical protein
LRVAGFRGVFDTAERGDLALRATVFFAGLPRVQRGEIAALGFGLAPAGRPLSVYVKMDVDSTWASVRSRDSESSLPF